MSDTIGAALTPEEWAAGSAEFGRYTVSRYQYDCEDGGIGVELQVSSDLAQKDWSHAPDELVHAAAALCLHGQPFGFTQDDVTTILNALNEGAGWYGVSGDTLEELKGIMVRIEALLPPLP